MECPFKPDLTEFVLQHALLAAREVIEEAERLQFSARDSLRVLELLENPPAPNARLLAAARALPSTHERRSLARRADRQGSRPPGF